MTGKEALEKIQADRTPDLLFIRWWRREEDYLDFDTIENFLANTKGDEELDGFALFGESEMWGFLEKVAPGRVRKTQKGGMPLLAWRRQSGEERHCPFTPQSFIDIFDSETRGNYVD